MKEKVSQNHDKIDFKVDSFEIKLHRQWMRETKKKEN